MKNKKGEVNVNTSKVMQCSWRVNEGRLNLSLNGKMLEEVDHLKYLGSQIGRDRIVGSRC